MFLISGLGNPGKKYQKTWHNFGFLVIDEFAKKNRFPEFKLVKKFQAKITKKSVLGKEIILVKPQTFMNSSGIAIEAIIRNLKLPISNLWVVHDDISLPLGKIKISKNRGAGGHKGVESIIEKLKSKNFVRFRLGIKPQNFSGQIKEFVLKTFNKNEEKFIKNVIATTVEAIEFALKSGLEKAMQKYNQ